MVVHEGCGQGGWGRCFDRRTWRQIHSNYGVGLGHDHCSITKCILIPQDPLPGDGSRLGQVGSMGWVVSATGSGGNIRMDVGVVVSRPAVMSEW